MVQSDTFDSLFEKLRNTSVILSHLFFFLIVSGIYGVGKAAEHPPALAVLSHTPDGATQTIAWVGKGIVYDTGGLSIKGKVLFILWRSDNGPTTWVSLSC